MTTLNEVALWRVEFVGIRASRRCYFYKPMCVPVLLGKYKETKEVMECFSSFLSYYLLIYVNSCHYPVFVLRYNHYVDLIVNPISKFDIFNVTTMLPKFINFSSHLSN